MPVTEHAGRSFTPRPAPLPPAAVPSERAGALALPRALLAAQPAGQDAGECMGWRVGRHAYHARHACKPPTSAFPSCRRSSAGRRPPQRQYMCSGHTHSPLPPARPAPSPRLPQEYFSCAPAEERDAADALMEREFRRLAHMNVGAIDDAFKQVPARQTSPHRLARPAGTASRTPAARAPPGRAIGSASPPGLHARARAPRLPLSPQFRQAMFKLEFKARQQLDAGRAAAAGSNPRKRLHPAEPHKEAELSGVFHGDAAFRQQAMLHLRRLLNACSDGTY